MPKLQSCRYAKLLDPLDPVRWVARRFWTTPAWIRAPDVYDQNFNS